MKPLFILLSFFLLFTPVRAQFPGHNIHNIEVYFGDMLEQQRWDFDKEYRWSFYICADDAAKLTEAQKELTAAGFSNFELIPNSMEQATTGIMLHMLSFEKTVSYTPATLLNDITVLYTLEQNYRLSSFDDYGNYELLEEAHPAMETAATGKSPIF